MQELQHKDAKLSSRSVLNWKILKKKKCISVNASSINISETLPPAKSARGHESDVGERSKNASTSLPSGT